MADIVPNVVVSMPSQLFTLARSFKAAANGRIYIGKIDTDPTIPENQIQVYLENEDGSHVPMAQPIMINSGGYPVYGGQIAKFVTVQGHSMAVYDAFGVQQFYFPNVLKYDPDLFRPYFDEKMAELYSPVGAYKIGYNDSNVGDSLDSLQFSKSVPGIYYGAFFENSNTAINIVSSLDGVTFSDPVRVTNGNGDLLRARDPSLIYYGGKWLLATTANTPGSVDLRIYSSNDLVSWSSNDIKLNGNSAICSNTVPWDGGTVPASLLWAGEFFSDPKTKKLYLIISILIGTDTTGGGSGRLFGTYMSELTDINTLKFSVPVRISATENDGSVNKYSRIDADIAYDNVSNSYIMAAKRENYGIIDVFKSSTISGPYSYANTITGMQTTGSSSGYQVRSGIEAPTIYKLRGSNTWAIAFDPNDTFDGINYVTSSDGFITVSAPAKLRMAQLRHGSIMDGSTLTPKALKDLHDCQSGISGQSISRDRQLNFIRITENCSIVPSSNTVYWADDDYNVTLVTPNNRNNNRDFPKNFYFCFRSNNSGKRLVVTGSVAGGPWNLGFGRSNNQIVEFFYEFLSNTYRCEIQGGESFTQTRLKADAGGSNSINGGGVTWYPRHGRTYVITDSDGPMTINALPEAPVGTYFNVVIQSGTNSFVGLTLKANAPGNKMGMPTDWAYNGGASNYDSRIIRIEKGSDLWFATK